MTVKEAWRVERERGVEYPNTTYTKMPLVPPDRSLLGRALGTVLGGAIMLTVIGVAAKLLWVVWRWILAP